MLLIIDHGAAPKLILLYSLQPFSWARQESISSREGALLEAIEQLLATTRQPLEAIEGIGVVVGKGSFTSTRVAVTVANTLALALHAKVVALTDGTVEQFMDLLKISVPGQLVAATYSAPPRLGGSSPIM